MEEINKDEFCRRFVEEMMTARSIYGGTEAELRTYANQASETYWDEPDQRSEGPEECARSDIGYWEQ